MKIIDFSRKGNLVRFYLGRDRLKTWYGDDWDDVPYEHNAGTVYEEYVSGHVDVCFPFNWCVLEPSQDYRYQSNSPWCKDDMRERRVPCIVALPIDDNEWMYSDCFERCAVSDRALRFYMGDSPDVLPAGYIVEEVADENTVAECGRD